MPIQKIRKLVDIPTLSPFADGKWWYLRDQVEWSSEKVNYEICIPAQFVMDLASVPLPIRMVLPRWAKYGPAAIVHDWLYWSQQGSRWSADQFMLEEMRKAGVNKALAGVMYAALRVGGILAWGSNRRAKQRGDRRMLEGFPESPYETWKQYQKRVWSGVA
jgi:hypothetical protein